MSSVFIVVFIIVLGYIIYAGVSTYVKNENSPVVATKARLADKRANTHTQTDTNGMVISTDESHYLIFELDTGSRMKFSVSGRIYRNAQEGEWGTLTFQGTRFIRYETSSGVLEK